MKTPFAVINTEDRPRTQLLADHERRHLENVGAELEKLARAMRTAKTVRDAVDLEIQIEKQAARTEAQPGTWTQGAPLTDASFVHEETEDLAITPADVAPAIALYGFMGWLTSRDEVAGPFSSRHEAASAPELIERFCASQGYTTDLPEDWNKQLRSYPTASEAERAEVLLEGGPFEIDGQVVPASRLEPMGRTNRVIVDHGEGAAPRYTEHYYDAAGEPSDNPRRFVFRAPDIEVETSGSAVLDSAATESVNPATDQAQPAAE